MNLARSVLVLLATTLAVYAVETPLARKPNVIFLLVDDFKPLLGCYDVPWIQPTNIDCLSANRTIFTSNHCPVSTPSRASLGPETNHLFLHPKKPSDWLCNRWPDLVALPQQFRNNGYNTPNLHNVLFRSILIDLDDRASWVVPYAAPLFPRATSV